MLTYPRRGVWHASRNYSNRHLFEEVARGALEVTVDVVGFPSRNNVQLSMSANRHK